MGVRLLASLLLLSFSAEVTGALLILDDVERGEFTSTGTNFNGTDFMVIGESVTHMVPEYRSFLTFDLSGVTGVVTSAELSLQVDNYNATSSFDFSIYDYTLGNDAILGFPVNSVDVFNDLGTGVQYGSASVNTFANPVGDSFTVTLNAAAINDLNNGLGGLFTVGFADDLITGGSDANIRLDRDPSLRVNQLILQVEPEGVPEPGALLLVCLGAVGGGARWLQKRRKSLIRLP